MDKRMHIEFPEIEFDSNTIIREAEKRIQRKRKIDQIIYLALIALLGIGMFFGLVFFRQYFIILQIGLIFIFSPVILILNFLGKSSGKEHSHGY